MDSATTDHNIAGLVQDCSNFSALAMELLQSCTELSIYSMVKPNVNQNWFSIHDTHQNHLAEINLKQMFWFPVPLSDIIIFIQENINFGVCFGAIADWIMAGLIYL